MEVPISDETGMLLRDLTRKLDMREIDLVAGMALEEGTKALCARHLKPSVFPGAKPVHIDGQLEIHDDPARSREDPLNRR